LAVFVFFGEPKPKQMKTRQLLLFAVILFSLFTAKAQKVFDDGYFIDSSGKKTTALIRTISLESLNDNNASIEFRNAPDGISERIGVDKVIEVGIGSDIKIRKFNVELDDADLFNISSTDKYPKYQNVTVFLNILIESQASLYAYESSRGTKYFYNVSGKGDKIAQLLYKKYIYSANMAPREVNEFRQQLYDDLKCDGDSFDSYSKLKYDRATLVAVFEKFNSCNSKESLVYKNEKKKISSGHLTILAGLQNHFIRATNVDPTPDSQTDFSYNFGLEFELLTSAKKWGMFGRLEVESLKADLKSQHRLSPFSDDVRHDSYDFETIAANLSFGGRYYMNPEANHNFFVDFSGGFSIPLSGELKHGYYISNPGLPDTATSFNVDNLQTSAFFALGLGYTFSKQFGIELKGNVGKRPNGKAQSSATISYSSVGINARYTLL
jgi:hypothetical protein